MKKLLVIILTLTVLVSCKKEGKSQNTEDTISTKSEERTAKQNDGLTHLKGEFVYYNGAAVLQTHAEIYGVLLTEKLEELDEQAKQYKSEPTDMVLVEIRGKITNEKHETILWENKVEVKEILSVKPASKEENNIIKLGS
ncbi:hypothetical protein MHTCC0001_08880 [Flavobacteriaceae bacterium MHTCC 0001]